MNANPSLSFMPTSSLHSHSNHHQFEIDQGQENEMKSNLRLSSNPMTCYNFDRMISQVIESNLNQHLQSADLKVVQKHSINSTQHWLIEKNLTNLNLDNSKDLSTLTPNSTTTNSNSKQSINLITLNSNQTFNLKPQIHQIPKFNRALSDSGHFKQIKLNESVCSDREIKFNSISTPLHPENNPRSQLTQWREEAIEYVKKREEIQAWVNALPNSFDLNEIHEVIDWELVKEEENETDYQLIDLVSSNLEDLKIEN
ncbi:hypothetical protein DFH28DRAFT_880840 [Melampsora americana]|nr:hypothetical protein DFH28DRAFT_880840 [Melampsora americana]